MHNEVNVESFMEMFQKIGWPKNLNLPMEGNLLRQQLTILLGAINEISSSKEVYIYQELPHSIVKENKDCDLVKCSFKEVLQYFDNYFKGYLFSADKSWLVFTHTDLDFTILGGPKKLIDNLISSDLEVLECTANTRVDSKSDELNLKLINDLQVPKLNWWRKLFRLK